MQKELGSQLSKDAVIFGPEDPLFGDATSRWNTLFEPTFEMVVLVGDESDVQKTVLFCNERDIPFLAASHNHGFTQSLGSFRGVQINLSQLDNIAIQADSKSAWLSAGVNAGRVTRHLWENGYVTTTGSCDCVGLVGVGLGGGHGRHEGLYGMISDNMLQFNVVLADGQAIRVNGTNHPELFWAMRGAGHNFGIVTSFELRVWPRGPDTWHYHNYVWHGNDLEAVFTALNELHQNGSTPVNMALNYGTFVVRPDIDNRQPVIVWTFAYRGTSEAASPYLAPFNAITPLLQSSGDVPYPEISKAQSTDESSAICQHGKNRMTMTIGLQTYNTTSERRIFDDFARMMVSQPELAAGAAIIHEGYSTKAAQERDPDSSAYPFRQDHHLMAMQIILSSRSDSVVATSRIWTDRVRQLWLDGQPHRPATAYVNYANGFETLEQMYGSERWRRERLNRLKRQYDPHNRFRYYNPIIRTN
ncbi:uncharacterized protein B0I36DRAFT_377853 [Microdochium trichocladiopsis]|uniref:FAD-binding PCMH-type domain-containing protein n=1 Tax=Microdochium trichocladiopsis TaxID=1682393 RepID=A0A9P8XT52_9PEZI|nr:uncharacterized protein B0I36DRAFT_377853 [Microdochium trichocladiopsis]KAH7016276.1 hypothetical protein B0I36DRAFT_377853 [Microdochium trichocladiopsis]